MRLIISGGGTGGHFFPALEVLKEAQRRKVNTLFVGTSRGIEKSFEESVQGDKLFLDLSPLRGVSPIGRLVSALRFLRGTSLLWKEVGGEFSSLVFGGYACVPVGILTILKGKKLYLHEQNSVPSMTNRTFFPFSRKVFITFEHTRKFFKGDKVIRTGVPVRRELLDLKLKKEEAKELLGFDPRLEVVLFMGGSQGAKFLNSLAVDFAKKTGFQTVLLSGGQDYERVKELAESVENIKVFPFRTDMALIYSASDVALCRAGAGTVTELSLFSIPAVFVPYPYAAGDHQYYNAKEIEDLGGAFVVRQEDVSLNKVIALVEKALSEKEAMGKAIRSFANPGATELILDEVFKD